MMAELFASPFFGISLSVIAFWVGVRIQKKTGLVLCNPLLIAIVLVSGLLLRRTGTRDCLQWYRRENTAFLDTSG